MSDYKLWLEQEVWVDGVEKQKRREMLKGFAEDIVYMMREKGYVFVPEYKIFHTVARWLYEIHVKVYVNRTRDIPYPPIYHRNWQEDEDHFYFLCDTAWVERWKQAWGEVEDFDPQTEVGKQTWAEFQKFLYTFIDMDRSPAGLWMEEFLFGADTSSESSGDRVRRGRKSRDVYLAEMEQGYHGDGWGR